MNLHTDPTTPALPSYIPSGRLQVTGLIKFFVFGLLSAVALGGLYAHMTSVLWTIPAMLGAAVMMTVVVGVVALVLAKKSHSRSLRFNAIASSCFALLVVCFKWLFVFAEIGGWASTLDLLTSAPTAWLFAMISLAQKAGMEASHQPATWALLLTWSAECFLWVAFSIALGKSQAREPYSEATGVWADDAFSVELFEQDGAAKDFFARLQVSGATLLLKLHKAQDLLATPVSAQWWTVKVAGKWVPADTTARWLDLTILVHTRDENGKVKSRNEAALSNWSVDEAIFLQLDALATQTTGTENTTVSVEEEPTPTELQPAVTALNADQFALAFTLAKPHVNHPQKQVKADAFRLCALALSRQSQWTQAFDHYHQLFDIEPTTMNALQAATTAVMAGELVLGQAWFEQAERLNAEHHDMASPALRTRFISALEQAGELSACMPHLEWLAQAYKAHALTDSHLLWTRGLPPFGVFLEKALPILRSSLSLDDVGHWYNSLRDAVDDDGKKQVDSFLLNMSPEQPSQGSGYRFNAEGLSEQAIRAYFDNQQNQQPKRLDSIFAELGQPTKYDDWDWGRTAYEWLAPGVRMRIVARGGYSMFAEELDPHDRSRFGSTLRVFWGNCSP